MNGFTEYSAIPTRDPESDETGRDQDSDHTAFEEIDQEDLDCPEGDVEGVFEIDEITDYDSGLPGNDGTDFGKR